VPGKTAVPGAMQPLGHTSTHRRQPLQYAGSRKGRSRAVAGMGLGSCCAGTTIGPPQGGALRVYWRMLRGPWQLQDRGRPRCRRRPARAVSWERGGFRQAARGTPFGAAQSVESPHPQAPSAPWRGARALRAGGWLMLLRRESPAWASITPWCRHSGHDRVRDESREPRGAWWQGQPERPEKQTQLAPSRPRGEGG